MTSPKVSVIIPTYKNHEELNRCIVSLINQTYNNIEIVVVNDCPHESIDDHINVDIDLSYISIKTVDCEVNYGGSGEGARNIGTLTATGEYVFYVDDDDWLEMECIEHLLSFYLENECDVVAPQGATGKDGEKEREVDIPKPNDDFGDWLRMCNYVGAGFFMPIETAKKFMYDEDCFCGDWELSIRVAAKLNIGVVEEHLYIYEESSTKEMRDIYGRRFQAHKYIYNKHKQYYDYFGEKENILRLQGLDLVYLNRVGEARDKFKQCIEINPSIINILPYLITYIPFSKYVFDLADKFKWQIKKVIRCVQ